jgi:hypothetical protein
VGKPRVSAPLYTCSCSVSRDAWFPLAVIDFEGGPAVDVPFQLGRRLTCTFSAVVMWKGPKHVVAGILDSDQARRGVTWQQFNDHQVSKDYLTCLSPAKCRGIPAFRRADQDPLPSARTS